MKKCVIIISMCFILGCSNQPDDIPECDYCECNDTYDCDCECNEIPDCSEVDDYYVFLNKLHSAPRDIASEEDLPEWLIQRINYDGQRPPQYFGTLIYKGMWWNNQIVYCIRDHVDSAIASFFTENGQKINNVSYCHVTSNNWILIYDFGDSFYNRKLLCDTDEIHVTDCDDFTNYSDEFFNIIFSAPKDIVSKEDLPEWLVVREKWVNIPNLTEFGLLIYKGEWDNNQIVYFELSTENFCGFYYFFTEDGIRIVDNLPDRRSTSKNWVLIYEFGDYFKNSSCYNQEKDN